MATFPISFWGILYANKERFVMIRKPIEKNPENLKKVQDYARQWLLYFKTHCKIECYQNYLENMSVTEHKFLELGFCMDCYESLMKAYDAIHGKEAHTKIRVDQAVDEINDPWILGDVLFCKWRYLGHWAYDSFVEFKPEIYIKIFSKMAGET